jgi:hypothetical protein
LYKKIPSSEQQKNLESKIIQELISSNIISFEKALSLHPIQRENLELDAVQNLISKKIINLKQILTLPTALSELEQTNLGSEAIQELILVNEIDLNQALSLNEKQRKNFEPKIVQDDLARNKISISAQLSHSLIDKKSHAYISDLSFEQTPFLSLEQMSDLIEEKNTKKKFNALVFSIEKSLKNGLELISFFKLLAERVNVKEVPSHFQLAIRDEDNSHWFAVDCYLEKGHLYLLILDPAKVSTTHKHLLVHFPGSSFKSKTIFCYNGKKIQHDGENCSFFVANLIFRLSNKTEHWEYLKSYLQQHPSSSVNTLSYYGINEQELPPSLAFIFKNMQSLKDANALPDTLKNICINKKGQTLRKAINTQLKRIETAAGKEKLRNFGITQKKEKYIKRLLSYQATKSIDFFKLHSIRQGFELIGGEEGKMIEQILHSYKERNLLNELITKNEILFKSAIKFLLEIIIQYKNEDFFLFLLKNDYLKELNPLPYIDDLIHEGKFSMFKDTLTHEDILNIKNN